MAIETDRDVLPATPSPAGRADAGVPWQADDGKKSSFGFLSGMLRTSAGYDRQREELPRRYPWLSELARRHDEGVSGELAFGGAREAMQSDGNLAMVVLRQFALAERKEELFFLFADHIRYGAYAQHLLYLLQRREEDMSAADVGSDRAKPLFGLSDTMIPEKHRGECQKTRDIIELRRNVGSAPHGNGRKFSNIEYFEEHKDEILEAVVQQFPAADDKPRPSAEEFEAFLKRFNGRYWAARSKNIDDVAFSTGDYLFDPSQQRSNDFKSPRMARGCDAASWRRPDAAAAEDAGADAGAKGWVSPRWLQIGKNLSQLGQLMGIQLERWTEARTGSPGIIAAFARAVREQEGVVKQLQHIIQERTGTVQRQEQVITALKFRHLMEAMPKPVAGRHAGFAAGGQSWRAFWAAAVEAAYRQYYAARARSDHAALDLRGFKSPLMPLLAGAFRAYYDQVDAYGRQPSRAARAWSKATAERIMKTKPIPRAMELYGTLSEVIHRYEGSRHYTSNALNWSPDDAQILEALNPGPGSEKEDFNWEVQRRKFE